MTKQTLLSLAERVEQASSWQVDNSPQFHKMRECDLEIAKVMGWTSAVSDGRGDRYGIPAYTASLDAAMSLVPEKCHWEASSTLLARKDDKPCASVWWKPDEHGVLKSSRCSARAEAATPALALTAAALRAHAARLS